MSESTLFDAALARLRRGVPLLGSAALTGSVMLSLPAQLGCVDAPTTGAVEAADWAQYEGHRNTTMVAFTGTWWSECSANTRFGCGSMAIHLTLRVKPVVGADLAWKRVGVVYHTPDDPSERTALGSYAGTNGDGSEQWLISFNTSATQPVLFDAWYQDGAGTTWIDDNQGELHVVNPGPAYQVLRIEPWLSTATVDDSGVHGALSLQVADLDFDKGIELVATTDGWKTILQLEMGAPGDKNKWYWSEDFPYGGRERWKIDLDLPGKTDRFEYAVAYRHGVVNGAATYVFWDNNGGANYVVARPVATAAP
jgi:Carbohydrate/starch-binding module (family 21)